MMNCQMFRVNWAIVPVLFLLLISLLACQSMRALSATPSAAVNIVSETEIVKATLAPIVTGAQTSMPLPTATLVPAPTKTSIPTTTPTVNPTQNMQKIAELPVIASNFTISDDGKLLVYEDREGVVHILDTDNWEMKWEFYEENRGMVGHMVRDFSADGHYLAGAGVEQDVYVWDMVTGERVYAFDVPFQTVDSISFSPDGKYLVISAIENYSGRSPVIWDLTTGEKIPNDIAFQYYPPYILATIFIPNQDQTNLLAIITANLNPPEEYREGERIGGLYFWNMDTKQLREVISGLGGTGLTTSPNGQILVAAVGDYYRFWDMQNDREFPNVNGEKFGGSTTLSLTDGGLIATANSEGLIVLNLEGKLLARLIPEQTITNIEFISDNELLIAYYADPQVPLEIWRIGE